jgi:hypothetical protein
MRENQSSKRLCLHKRKEENDRDVQQNNGIALLLCIARIRNHLLCAGYYFSLTTDVVICCGMFREQVFEDKYYLHNSVQFFLLKCEDDILL